LEAQVPKNEDKLAGRSPSETQLAFPNPDLLTAYKNVDPRFVEMLVDAFKREQRHRHWRAAAPEWTARLGVVCGLVIGVAGLVAAGYIASIGAAIPGALLGAADLLGLVGVFVYGSRQQIVPRGLLPSSQRKSPELPQRKSPELPLPGSGDATASSARPG
jgi:uncharacterized membrane protein